MLRFMYLLAAVSTLGVAVCVSAAPGPANKKKRGGNQALFAKPRVLAISIEIAEPALAALKKDNRTYVQAQFHEGGKTYTNVGIRLKGVGSFRPLDQKAGFSLKFNKFTPGQEFYGLSKIALNNSVQDVTYVNEILCSELFRAAGVPAARATHAWVQLNGRDLGMYVLVEGYNKDFLRLHFQSDQGALYEGYTQDIDDTLELDNGEDSGQAELRALTKAALDTPSGERWTRLAPLLEVDAFISMMAVEMITAHWDGYWMNRNNYRIYHDPETQRLTFIPCGLDNMFQNPGMSWRPTMRGLVTRGVLQTPQGQRQYRERMLSLLTNEVFTLAHLTNRIQQIAGLVRPVLAAKTPAAVSDYEEQVGDLARRVVERMRSLRTQMDALTQPATFDRSGYATLAGWKTQVDAGPADLLQTNESTRAVLKIKSASTAGCIASWRARAVLDGGRYRFEGRVRTQNLLPVKPGELGATLRITGLKPPPQVSANTDWRAASIEFAVPAEGDEVELVCELSAILGEAAFDLNSLRLVRLSQ